MSGALPRAQHWRARRVLVTGHTGFVGGWLSTWLARLGAKVHGYSLEPPSTPSFFDATGLASHLASSTRGDIRDRDGLDRAFRDAAPQDVFHLAAQPIVRTAFRDPVETFSTNVMGTVHVMEACRARSGVERIVAYTTDKVYRNDQSGRAFDEGDPLGGNEPYSASKAAADGAIAAYARGYFEPSPRVAIVRAGNIVGGGDWGADRLLPDAARAFAERKALVIRNPHATRPWQHVLDAVRGTLLIAERMEAKGEDIAWNLGPSSEGESTVSDVADLAMNAWGEGAAWRHEPDASIAESKVLRLSSEKAARRLAWRCAWDVKRAVAESVAWYKAFAHGDDAHEVTLRQIDAYVADVERQP